MKHFSIVLLGETRNQLRLENCEDEGVGPASRYFQSLEETYTDATTILFVQIGVRLSHLALIWTLFAIQAPGMTWEDHPVSFRLQPTKGKRCCRHAKGVLCPESACLCIHNETAVVEVIRWNW